MKFTVPSNLLLIILCATVFMLALAYESSSDASCFDRTFNRCGLMNHDIENRFEYCTEAARKHCEARKQLSQDRR